MPDWQGKVAIVTGGSAGLGFSIARAFVKRRANVVIAARGRSELELAAQQLVAEGTGGVLVVPTDITQSDQVDSLIKATLAQWGRLDALVNNAGRSMRGRAIDTTAEQFRDLLDLNLLAVVRLTQAAVPHLLQGRGHLINIGSLAGKSAARWLGAYPASKFALTAYTQQLRLELGPEGLHVLLVCPGPIARERPRDYIAAGSPAVPESATRPGAGVKLRAIDRDWLAERIIGACERREPELVIPRKARLMFAISQLSPRLGDWILRHSS